MHLILPFTVEAPLSLDIITNVLVAWWVSCMSLFLLMASSKRGSMDSDTSEKPWTKTALLCMIEGNLKYAEPTWLDTNREVL